MVVPSHIIVTEWGSASQHPQRGRLANRGPPGETWSLALSQPPAPPSCTCT